MQSVTRGRKFTRTLLHQPVYIPPIPPTSPFPYHIVRVDSLFVAVFQEGFEVPEGGQPVDEEETF